MVALGYKLEFQEFPPFRFLRSNVPKDPVKKKYLFLALDRLMSPGVIIEVPSEERDEGFYSNLFTVPKSNGDVRPIQGSESLPKHLLLSHGVNPVSHIHPMGRRSSSIHRYQSCVSTCANIFHSPEVSAVCGRAASLSVRGLALRISHRSPGIYKGSGPGTSKTKGPSYSSNGIPRRPVTGRSVNSTVKPWGVQNGQLSGTPGLDSQCREIILTASKKAGILGLVIDTTQERVFLPQAKVNALRELVQVVKARKSPSIRLCMRLLGKMVASLEAVPYAQFHSRQLQHSILSGTNRSKPWIVQ